MEDAIAYLWVGEGVECEVLEEVVEVVGVQPEVLWVHVPGDGVGCHGGGVDV